MQLFQYAILSSTVIRWLTNLDEIDYGNDEVNSLYSFLLNNDKKSVISSFCKNLVNKFSNSSILPKERLVMMNINVKDKISEKFKSEVFSIASNKSGNKIMIATQQGLVDKDVKHGIRNIMSRNKIISLTGDMKMTRFELPSDKHNPLITDDDFSRFKERKEPQNPRIIISHPREDFAIIADKNGEIYSRNYHDPSKLTFFEPKCDGQINSLSISNDGTMFGAGYDSTARIYSFYSNEQGRNLFADYDTWSDKITCMSFVKGSGLFACGQIPNEQCKGNVTFWDCLLPNSSAMIASVKFSKGEDPICMDYSYLENHLIVGTSKGTIMAIDTRMFEVVHTYKAHSKGVYALKIDKNEAYFASGGIGGKVKIWNLHSAAMVKQIEVPGFRNIKNIDINYDHIYVAYNEGYAQINLGQ